MGPGLTASSGEHLDARVPEFVELLWRDERFEKAEIDEVPGPLVRPLAEQVFELIVPDRRGYGASPATRGEDFLADAEDIADMMGDGAHLVGHSYGGLGAMLAAARRPDAARSLTLLEPAAGTVARHDQAWHSVVSDGRQLWGTELPDHERMVRFSRAVGSDPDQFPPEMLAAAVPLVPVFRCDRPFYDAVLPLAELAAAPLPKHVVSGGHSPGFDAMCVELANCINGAHSVVVGQATRPSSPASRSTTRSWHCGNPRQGDVVRDGAWPRIPCQRHHHHQRHRHSPSRTG